MDSDLYIVVRKKQKGGTSIETGAFRTPDLNQKKNKIKGEKTMAKEIKSFKCHPDYEQAEINFRQKVGWEFVSTQEIYNKDTHMESSVFSDTITSVTETTHYVKLTFQREPDKVNPELISLERKIDTLSPPEEPYYWGWIAIGIGLCCFILPGVGLIYLNKMKRDSYKIEKKEWSDEFDRLMARVDELQ